MTDAGDAYILSVVAACNKNYAKAAKQLGMHVEGLKRRVSFIRRKQAAEASTDERRRRPR